MKQKNIPPVKISFQENLLPKLGEGKAHLGLDIGHPLRHK
jgi:hypothetical protein